MHVEQKRFPLQRAACGMPKPQGWTIERMVSLSPDGCRAGAGQPSVSRSHADTVPVGTACASLVDRHGSHDSRGVLTAARPGGFATARAADGMAHDHSQ